MSNNGRHVFTAQETLEGVRASVMSRRDQAKLIKKLAKMDFDKTTVEKIVEFFKVIVSSPPGLFLTGSLIIDGLEALGYFGATENSTNNNQVAQGAANAFFQGFTSVFPTGAKEFLQGIISTSGTNVPPGRVTAAYLNSGLFIICLTEALGGGQGLSTLATAAISALK